mmetsp:Transcript_90651/g.163608  ORF Transcript_90651/g.163608 Transcript_90651/m.163608 type:complete len:80 (+) Transcript_90651:3-242(+)
MEGAGRRNSDDGVSEKIHLEVLSPAAWPSHNSSESTSDPESDGGDEEGVAMAFAKRSAIALRGQHHQWAPHDSHTQRMA